jgi:hypothetical protein
MKLMGVDIRYESSLGSSALNALITNVLLLLATFST